MTEEEWRPIPAFERFYEVSSHGNVRSWHSGEPRPVKPVVRPDGYPQVKLSVGGKKTLRLVHALVALTFIGPRPEGAHVCHNDGDPGNSHAGNLRYDSPRGNSADREGHGTLYRPTPATCKHGHSLADAYVITRPARVPGRTTTVHLCRTCARIKNHENYLRRKTAT